jgi:hypothetical protein
MPLQHSNVVASPASCGAERGDIQPVVEAVPGHSHQTAKFGKLWRGSASRTSLLTSLTMTTHPRQLLIRIPLKLLLHHAS